jgi:hypothetical protein
MISLERRLVPWGGTGLRDYLGLRMYSRRAYEDPPAAPLRCRASTSIESLSYVYRGTSIAGPDHYRFELFAAADRGRSVAPAVGSGSGRHPARIACGWPSRLDGRPGDA